jgi:hypothetical protein
MFNLKEKKSVKSVKTAGFNLDRLNTLFEAQARIFMNDEDYVFTDEEYETMNKIKKGLDGMIYESEERELKINNAAQELENKEKLKEERLREMKERHAKNKEDESKK